MQIFVGNLSWSTTEEDLHRLFYGYGTVASVRIMTGRGDRPFPGLRLCRDAQCQRGPGGDRGVERDGVRRTDADRQ